MGQLLVIGFDNDSHDSFELMVDKFLANIANLCHAAKFPLYFLKNVAFLMPRQTVSVRPRKGKPHAPGHKSIWSRRVWWGMPARRSSDINIFNFQQRAERHNPALSVYGNGDRKSYKASGKNYKPSGKNFHGGIFLRKPAV